MLFDDTPSSGSSKVKEWTAEEEKNKENFSYISTWAIVSLIGGIISLITIINHSLFWIPLAFLGLTIWSYWLIHRSEGTLTGKGFLRTALFFITLSLIEAPVQDIIYYQNIISQARSFFTMVIEAAQSGDTYEIHQLKNWLSDRQDTNDETAYWKELFSDPVTSLAAAEFIRNPGLLALTNLGKNAKITYDRTLGILKDPSRDTEMIVCAYAVTYTEFGESKTFLIQLSATRRHDKKNSVSFWKFNTAGKEPLKK